VIGAGLPVGAYGGKADIMEYVAPNGPVYQAGTLSGNPLAMTAGYTLLHYLKEHPEVYDSLAAKTQKIENGLRPLLEAKGIAYQINRLGSMISLHFTDTPVKDFNTAQKGDNPHFKNFFHQMLQRGVYLPPSAYESWFLNDALSDSDIDHTLNAAEASLKHL
jgi:glutamate-1-semialdehyde 2,1-aminomutase